ncbi:MAG: hypothetical protein LUI87_03420 [Lachnospiraceae bacterium]|nr:hypothetical protein [Lachnospiraceae bacterium]
MRFKNINIIINPADNANYLFFAEFFKLCGVFVVKSEAKPFEDTTYAGASLTEPETHLDIRKKWHWSDIEVDDRWEINEKYLLNEAIRSVFKADQEVIPCALDVLADAYVEADLVHWNCLERYFYDPSPSRLKRCRSAFFKAIAILEKCTKHSVQTDVWYRYFLINCKNKVNNLCQKLGKEPRFNVGELLDGAFLLGLTNSNCRQGYVLTANVADSYWQYYSTSRIFYERAKNLDSFWDAYVSYRLGRYYEKMEDDREKALEFYKKSFSLAPWNYRSLYKVALLDFSKGNVTDATAEFIKMDQIFQNETKYLNYQPIHLEYLIKSYRRLEEIYRVWWEEPKLALYMENAVQKLGKVIANNRFFDEFFRSPNDEDWTSEEKYALLTEFESRGLFDMAKRRE